MMCQLGQLGTWDSMRGSPIFGTATRLGFHSFPELYGILSLINVDECIHHLENQIMCFFWGGKNRIKQLPLDEV